MSKVDLQDRLRRDLKKRLLANIQSKFSEEELQTLCFNLDIEYSDLGADTHTGRVRELIRRMERREQLLDLVRICREQRPKTDWGADYYELVFSTPAPVHNSFASGLSDVDQSLGDLPLSRIPSTRSNRQIVTVFLIVLLLVLIGVWYLQSNWPTSIPETTPVTTSITTPAAQVAAEDTRSAQPNLLLSFRYKTDNADPRLVDLRRVSTSGIPVRERQLLQFLDLKLFLPQDIPNGVSWIWLEVYDDPETSNIVGHTEAVELQPGEIQMGDISITQYADGHFPQSWLVQPHWRNLYIVLVTQHDDGSIDRQVIRVHLNPDGVAWLVEPPIVTFASIVYSINQGPDLVLDFRDVMESGLGVTAGDILTVHEIWYHANAENDIFVQVESHLSSSSGEFNPDTYQVSARSTIRQGIHSMASFTPLTWMVPDDLDGLVLNLTRTDGPILDSLILPLNDSLAQPGLVRHADAILWPFSEFSYLDFESPANLERWVTAEGNTRTLSSDYSFTGASSLAITISSSEPNTFIRWHQPLQSEIIVGQIYLPSQDGIEPVWLQACVLDTALCTNVNRVFWSIIMDRWITFVIDLSQPLDGAETETLNQSTVQGIFLQGQIGGITEDNHYTFYVDGIQIYPAQQP
jgi:hypothetical protein